MIWRYFISRTNYVNIIQRGCMLWPIMWLSSVHSCT